MHPGMRQVSATVHALFVSWPAGFRESSAMAFQITIGGLVALLLLLAGAADASVSSNVTTTSPELIESDAQSCFHSSACICFS